MSWTMQEVRESSCLAVRPALAADRRSILTLLSAEGLPTESVGERASRFWVAEDRTACTGSVAGVAGLEMYGDTAVLRSVAVAPRWRGSGLGRLLTERALDEAETAGARDIVLLAAPAEPDGPAPSALCLTRGGAPTAAARSMATDAQRTRARE